VLCACARACVRVFVCARARACVCVLVRAYVCARACVRACGHVCVYDLRNWSWVALLKFCGTYV